MPESEQQPIDPLEIIGRFYKPGTKAHDILIEHGRQVAGKALAVAGRLAAVPDVGFIREAAMLHDIGIFKTRTPSIGCYGDAAYVCHGYLGGILLRELGLPRHARVCENHVGTGLSAAEIAARGLPLPVRDMLPTTIEEQLVCYADKFFSKSPGRSREKTVETVISGLEKFGTGQVQRFCAWVEQFEGRNVNS